MYARSTGYPRSVLSHVQTPDGLIPNVTSKPDNENGPALARHTTHIKIESPSVVAAAKKAASEKIENEAPDTESSVTSDEDTLVCKSKSGKSNAGDAVISPTKAKL